MSGDQRIKRAKLNIVFSLIGQAITLVCGLIVPRLLIKTFGSEAYGATTSIAQFLAYITLLEGGIGGVARAALYKPLSENNKEAVGGVLAEIQHFFRIIGWIFLIYVIVLAFSFKSISHVECLDGIATFSLVIAISIATFAQYFIGISYQVLLNAAQRVYITQLFSSAVTILNTVSVIVLVSLGSNLILVKLIGSIVFLLKPIGQFVYVRKKLKIVTGKERNEKALEQKWSGLGQHLAYFLHTNTDIAVLTVLANLSYVAVYSVYNMVVSQIQNVIGSFSNGMEAVFGDMLAKNERQSLSKAFDVYESLISVVAGVLFSVTAVMIIPFIKLYTNGINDTSYIYPMFAILLIIASYVFCIRIPYHTMTIAAGHFKQTQIAAYGEAIINIVLSIILVLKFNLIGVAVGTIVAVTFRTIYYVWYLSKNIFYRKARLFLKRILCNACEILLVCILGNSIINTISITNYFSWCICSLIVLILSIAIHIVGLSVFYKSDFRQVLSKILKK